MLQTISLLLVSFTNTFPKLKYLMCFFAHHASPSLPMSDGNYFLLELIYWLKKNMILHVFKCSKFNLKARFSLYYRSFLKWYFYWFSYFYSKVKIHKFMKYCKFWRCDSPSSFLLERDYEYPLKISCTQCLLKFCWF